MTIQDEAVAHKSLVDGSETILHSHAGGGGANVKSGQASGGSESFNTVFSSVPNIVITPLTTDNTMIYSAHILTKSISGFTYKVFSQDGRYTTDVTSSINVEWIATDTGNP